MYIKTFINLAYNLHKAMQTGLWIESPSISTKTLWHLVELICPFIFLCPSILAFRRFSFIVSSQFSPYPFSSFCLFCFPQLVPLISIQYNLLFQHSSSSIYFSMLSFHSSFPVFILFFFFFFWTFLPFLFHI